jgi:hypothetical protein
MLMVLVRSRVCAPTLTLLINAARGATTRLEALPNEAEGAARTFTVEESILCVLAIAGCRLVMKLWQWI